MAYNNNYYFDLRPQSEQANDLDPPTFSFDSTLFTLPAGSGTSSTIDLGGIHIRHQNEDPWVANQPRFQTDFRPLDFDNTSTRAYTVADPANLGYHQRTVLNPHGPFANSSSDSAFYDGPGILQPLNTGNLAPSYAPGFLPQGDAPARPTSTKSAPVNRRKRARPHDEEIPCREEGCTKVLKGKSNLTKHMQQHAKSHICRVEGCTRTEGFGTENDLDRHQKSVHKMARRLGHGKEYVCAECRQTTDGELKTWDRRDNFKSHITRRHPGMNADSVISRSEKAPDSGFGGSQMTESPVYQETLTSDSAFMSATMSRNASYNSEATDSNFPQHQPDALFAGIGAGQMSGNSTTGNSLSPIIQYPGRRSFSQQMPQTTTMIGQTGPLDIFRPQATSCYSRPDQVSLSFGSYFAPDGMGPPQTDAHSQPASAVYPSKRPKSSAGEPTSHICPTCFKQKKRACDLRKHEKRHSRPYACTFAGCEMKLGSRNDWKRHESSQHHLKEMWWCSQCRETFDRHKVFAMHLEKAHSIPVGSEGNRQQCVVNRLGPEGHFNFWCGFCDRPIPQEDTSQSEMGSGMSAWEYRFKHIGDHYDKEERKIEDWTCPDQPLPNDSGPTANPTKKDPSVIRSQNRTFKDEHGIDKLDWSQEPRLPDVMAPPKVRPTMKNDVRRQATTTTVSNANATMVFVDDYSEDADGEDDNDY